MVDKPKTYNIDWATGRVAFFAVCILFGTFSALFVPVVWLSYQIWPDDSGARMCLNMPVSFVAIFVADYLKDKYKNWQIGKIVDKLNE
jgi:hypothetical protein